MKGAGTTKEAQAAGSLLCLSCGLCCDGALFDHVSVLAEEVDPLRLLGMTLIESEAATIFRQPCEKLAGTCCTIYDVRPATCRRFRCRLLKSLQAGGIDRAEAAEKVAKAKALIARVAPFLEPGQSIGAARKRWRDRPTEWLAAGTSAADRRSAAHFHLHMTALNLFLDQNFRDEARKQVVTDKDQAAL